MTPALIDPSRGTRSPIGLAAAERERLLKRKIFFGHQSVGENIIRGVRDLEAKSPGEPLRVVAAASPHDVDGPALVHATIGSNCDPSSKSVGFLAALADSAPDIALYKFCYVDVGVSTDVEALFADYVRTVEEARRMHPGLVIVHVTVPLTTAAPAGRIRTTVKRLLGRTPGTEAANNVSRNRYNALLRGRYAGRAPVFDLAEIESTRPDGSRSYFMNGKDTVETLALELTTDGGHLNPMGQRAAALELLSILSRA